MPLELGAAGHSYAVVSVWRNRWISLNYPSSYCSEYKSDVVDRDLLFTQDMYNISIQLCKFICTVQCSESKLQIQSVLHSVSVLATLLFIWYEPIRVPIIIECNMHWVSGSAIDMFDLCLVINYKMIIVWQVNGKHKSFQVVNLFEDDMN